MIHGTHRDADNYFRNALAAAFLGAALDDTVVIVPRIASNGGRGCQDKLAANEVSYACNGDSWRSGGISGKNDKLTSFDLVDGDSAHARAQTGFSQFESDRGCRTLRRRPVCHTLRNVQPRP